ncbi:MAG: hypothetical protein EPO40_00370 [Myxococcaceae bacterium]|nr:MAG: hypothetical protein EPO40_00370 [Myxococcaceae bacterium]
MPTGPVRAQPRGVEHDGRAARVGRSDHAEASREQVGSVERAAQGDSVQRVLRPAQGGVVRGPVGQAERTSQLAELGQELLEPAVVQAQETLHQQA